jgi:hypothetical protein
VGELAPARRASWVRRIALVVLLLVECGVAGYAVAQRFPSLWESRWVQDDAYVSFRYAHHMVMGEGLVYNPGEYVEGYTNFLWTVLSAIPIASGADDPLPFMHGVGVVLWASFYAILILFCARLGWEGAWAAPLAAVALAQHASFNQWFFSGMETPLVCVLALLAVVFFSRDPQRYPRTLLWASLSGVALTMTRPDGVVVLAALALTGLGIYWRRIFSRRGWVVYALMPALPVLLLWVPFNAWRVWYYGSFFPNTYYAKGAYLTDYSRGWEYFITYLQTYDLIKYLPLVIAGAVLAPFSLVSRFLVAAFTVCACVAIYVVRLGGDFMEWRFLTPATGILYPAIVVGGSLAAQQAAMWVGGRIAMRRARPLSSAFPLWAKVFGWLAGVAVAASLTMSTGASDPERYEAIMPGQETIGMLRRYCDVDRYDWRSVGKLFDSVLPRKVRIATTSAGIIPYFCDRPCLDQHGLTDARIAHEPIDPNNRGRVGHEHWLEDHAAIRARGVDIVLAWADPSPYPRALVTTPTETGELVSARLPDGRYVDFTLLKGAAVERSKLRRDRRLVFYGDVPVGDRREFYSRPPELDHYTIVDRLDWENGDSERAHQFHEQQPPGAPYEHSWHTKYLHYAPPHVSLLLEDGGRRIYGGASWKISGVSAAKPLWIGARYDHTGEASYAVTVNGEVIDESLWAMNAATEAWDESWVVVPPRFLHDGENQIEIERLPWSRWDAEWYFMWFLQPSDDGAQCSGTEPRCTAFPCGLESFAALRGDYGSATDSPTVPAKIAEVRSGAPIATARAE